MTVAGHPPPDGRSAILPADDVAVFTDRGAVRRFARGQALFHEGQLPDRVLLLRAGRVKVYRTTTGGREVVLAIRGPGELVGELAALVRAPRSASVVAIENVEALSLSPEDFVAFLLDRPRAALALLSTLAQRLRDADDKRVEFTAFTTMGRVALRLVELSDQWGRREGDAIHIHLPLSQQELADWTGSSIESVGRALQQMRALHWIETGRRDIRIFDVEALRRAAV